MKSKQIKLKLKPSAYHAVEIRLRAVLKYMLHMDPELRTATYLRNMIRTEIDES